MGSGDGAAHDAAAISPEPAVATTAAVASGAADSVGASGGVCGGMVLVS